MTVETNLAGEILEHLSGTLPIPVESVDTDLLESGALDSLAIIELVMHLEQTYNVEIPMQDLEIDDLRTVNRIAGLVAKRQGAQAA